MNICLIGNSHSAALKLAWDAGLAEKYPDVNVRFFPSRRPARNLQVIDRTLSIRSIAERSSVMKMNGAIFEVDADAMDGFILVGYGAKFTKLEKLSLLDEGRFLSQACLRRCIRDFVRTDTNMNMILTTVLSLTTKPVIAMPAPLVSVNILKNGVTAEAALRPLDRWDRIGQQGREEYEAYCLKLGVHSVLQPQETIVKGLYTRARYNTNTLLLPAAFRKMPHSEAPDRIDYNHMNVEFGTIMLELALSTINANA